MKDGADLERGFFDAYASAATNLRTWLVAYGIGAPVLFLSNEYLWQALARAKCARCVGILFLGGVALQLFIALVNKNVMWFCYAGEAKPALKLSWKYKLCDWLSERFCIDIGIDLASVAFLIVATYKVFCAVLHSPDA